MTFHRCQRFLMPRNVASSPLWLECRKRSTAGYLPRYRKLLLSLHRNRLYLARPFCLLCSEIESPNITAYFRFAAACDAPASGAVRDTGTDCRTGCTRTTGSNPTEKNLNASWASSVYGGSNSVQSPSIQALIIIKIWIARGCTVLLPKTDDDRCAEKSAYL